ncbi:hypothetical protein BH24GEM1_BH24GEM1_25070 [soil metagenome]
MSGAIASRAVLREEIADTLALLAGVARPDTSGSNQSFLTAPASPRPPRSPTALAHRELLQRYGIPDSFPDDLGLKLDGFETALNDKHAGQTAHLGANADLEAVTAEIMQLVRQLDALNRFRFRNDPESLGAWRSARNVAWPAGERQERVPQEGDVRPAA